MRANSLLLKVMASSAAASFGDHSRSTACASGEFMLPLSTENKVSARSWCRPASCRTARVLAKVGASGSSAMLVTSAARRAMPVAKAAGKAAAVTLSQGGTPL
jgi:hypothetical protein